MNHTSPDIYKLSAHLFWDVNQEEFSWDDHKAFIVGRVLDYGLWEDWKILNRIITIQEIAEIASNLRNLNPRSLAFISELSKKPIEEFKCYTTMQSIPPHWNF
jgi:hypothetical protein